ncbi:unnamed protein product [Tilletia controversa]|uniref:F-box domain-containing protein n=2 Tax=Tilletia TaxID=13289 RepID=A0A8X7N0G1_9BASI|nr:hypothetical protein CF328_g2633 [Tilletia controversa]KAE8254367.1 hypothetical protein A4X06_0g924 [Tilletia controversa]CAD6928975.1 unnamed protein product [Tilletia controversa]
MSTSSSSSTSPSPSFSSAPAFPLFDLPFELIRSIFVRCDYYSLNILRQVCKSFKNIVDSDTVFDPILFRIRPQSNPALTRDDLLEIKRLAEARVVHSDEPKPSVSKALNTYIITHPALGRLRWYSVDGRGVATFERKPNLVDCDPAVVKVAHVPDECATYPPVLELEIFMRAIVGFGSLTYKSPGVDQSEPTKENRPVLLNDVIKALVAGIMEFNEQHRLEHDCIDSEDENGSSYFRFTSPAYLQIRANGTLRFVYFN